MNVGGVGLPGGDIGRIGPEHGVIGEAYLKVKNEVSAFGVLQQAAARPDQGDVTVCRPSSMEVQTTSAWDVM